jgi:hypothetical protein
MRTLSLALLLLLSSVALATNVTVLQAPVVPGYHFYSLTVSGFDASNNVTGHCKYYTSLSILNTVCGWDLLGNVLYALPCGNLGEPACPTDGTSSNKITVVYTYQARTVVATVAVQGKDSQGNIAGEEIYPSRRGLLITP